MLFCIRFLCVSFYEDEKRKDIDMARAKAALERAEKRMAEQRLKEAFDFTPLQYFKVTRVE